MLSIANKLIKFKVTSIASNPLRAISFRTVGFDGQSEEDQKAARQWLDSFNTIPRRLSKITYSRSSGPGGQKVNKYADAKSYLCATDPVPRSNSKATLRVSVKDLESIVPNLVHTQLQASRFYAKNSESLIIQSDTSRSATANAEDCFSKLDQEVIAGARKAIQGATSPAQAARVKNLYVSSSAQYA